VGVSGESGDERPRTGPSKVLSKKATPAGISPATTKTGEAPPPKDAPKEARTSSGEHRSRRSSRRRTAIRWLRRISLGVLVLIAVGSIAVAVMVRRIEAGLPSVAELRRGYRPPQVTRVLASDGSTLAEIFTERRTVVKLDDLPAHVKLAVLAAEDAQFYEHHGLDYLGILRAVYVNLRHKGTKQGASTITQQVVKNLLLDSERTYTRKIREALLARRIEQELKKDEILELYLNHIYFGHGRYGIEEAARGYFGKHAKELTLAEAALLAGLPAGPTKFSPRVDHEAALRRRSFVLGQLLAKFSAHVKQSDYDAAMVEPVKLAPVVEATEEIAPEVVELVRKTIRDVAGEEAARRGGFTVETSIDPQLQIAARAALRESTSQYDKRWKLLGPFPPYPADGKDPKTKKKLPPQEAPFVGTPRFGHGETFIGVVVGHDDAARTLDVDVGTLHGIVRLPEKDRYDPTSLPPSAWAAIGTRLRVSLQAPPPVQTTAPGDAGPIAPVKTPLRLELGPEGAMVAIDVRTHRVVALVGNVEAAIGGLDRASHAHRQPGSTFKPFVYGSAIKARKVTPATLIEATPGDFGGWNPKNYEAWTKDEPVRLREALAQSINLVAVRVAKDVGPQGVIDFARSVGITSKLVPDLAIALGSYEVTPLELATAYTTFAAGGVYEEPTIITRLVGPDGREMQLPGKKPPVRALEEAEAYLITSLLTSVVEKGTAMNARVLQRPIAGKTGTSNLAKDTWFAGYTPSTVAVAWIGFDDARPLGAGEFGARTALPAWISLMREVTKGKPKVEFPRPQGVINVKIDPKTGKLPYAGQDDAIDEVFLTGTDPTEVAPMPENKDDKSTLPKAEAPEDPWKSTSSP